MAEKFDFYDPTNLKSYNLNSQIQYQLKVLEGLDVFTRRHSENVASIACRLCEYLGMDKGFTVYCTTCAYIHDIGKAFIPPEILQKPSKLTDEEYEKMKMHTTIGYKMCMDDPQLRPYSAGPLYHHEGLDGSGYPNHISGNKIPYEAQIIRVADEFEAITAKRQYKSHVGIVDTLKILIDNAIPKPMHLFGKIDKNVLKALFKVVIDDIDYEISQHMISLDYTYAELARLEKSYKYYKKAQKTNSESAFKEYESTAKYYLKAPETFENIPREVEELHHAIDKKQSHIKKLQDEISQVKKLHIRKGY